MKKYWFLCFIFIIALLFRFYRLGEVPLGLHRDEAFLGYNAYSILQTGRDMTGNILPLHFQSFLYSPAGYSYFSIPFIKVFGLSVFSVRFASAFFGSLTVVVIFFLIRQVIQRESFSFTFESTKEKIPFITGLVLAISPWHINLSRTATENTIVLFFVICAALLFFFWEKREQKWFLFLSFIAFGLTMFLYQAPRAFLPLFTPFFIWVVTPKKLLQKNFLLLACLYFFFILLPIGVIMSSSDLSLRIRTVSIFATDQTQLVINQQIREDGVFGSGNIVPRIFHNKIVGYSKQFLENYISHFSYNFLFADHGLPDRYRVPLVGLIYFFELPLLILGFISLIRAKNKIFLLFIGWLVIVPVGSALTFDDVPNLQRTLLMVPCFSFFTAVGILQLYNFFNRRSLTTPVIAIIGMFALWNVGYYFHQYYMHVDQYRPWYRQQGYGELVLQVDKLAPKYKKIVITDHESSPTIFFLFYKKYDPSVFQKNIKGKILDNYDRINFEKYEFTQEECPLREIKDKGIIGEKKVLYIGGGECKIPKGINILKTIYRLDNSVVFRVMSLE